MQIFEEVLFSQATYNIKQSVHLAYVSLMLGGWQKRKGMRLK